MIVIEEDEEGPDHGHQYDEHNGSHVSASSLAHGISRIFRNHRRAVIVLALFLIATGSLHFISQPYVDVHQARHILDGALKWGGKRVGLKGGFAESQAPECHFRSTVEGNVEKSACLVKLLIIAFPLDTAYHTALKRLRRERRLYESGEDPSEETEDDEYAELDELDLSSSNSGLRSNGSHYYSPSGHVVIADGEDGEHPIPQLLLLGEKRWEDMLARQSRTLEEAVLEYQRRYARNPPRGFDKWYVHSFYSHTPR